MHEDQSDLEELVEKYYFLYREGMTFATIREKLLEEEQVPEIAIKGIISMIDDLIIEEDAQSRLKGVYRNLFYGLLFINSIALIFLAVTVYSHLKQEIPFTASPGELTLVLVPGLGSFSGMFYVYRLLQRKERSIEKTRDITFASSRWNDYKSERK